MPRAAPTAAARCAALVSGLVLVVATPGLAGAADWQELLLRAVEEGHQRPFDGRLVVVSMDPGAPVLEALLVSQDREGTVMTSSSAAWMLGRSGGSSFLGDTGSRTLVRLGSVDRAGLDVDRIAGKYAVSVEGTESLPAGRSDVLVVRERDRGTVRERLYLDRRSGLIVRRETFDDGGEPLRVVAFTSLDLTPQDRSDPIDDIGWERVDASRREMTRHSVDVLREVGWLAPDALAGGFALVDASAIGQDGGSSLHLLYSDGLYAISLYEQDGRLDADAVVAEGARPEVVGDLRVYRWPGAQPTTVTWSGDDRTFTAVSDAPPDILAEAVSVLPHERPRDLAGRVGRGLSRVLHWVWPFD